MTAIIPKDSKIITSGARYKQHCELNKDIK